MRRFIPISTILLAILAFPLCSSFAQTLETSPSDAVRVTVTLNSDGSRTVYEFDNEHHKATAATTEPDGKLRGKIRYEIDQAGRFASGVILGPDEKFLFKSIYKYDSAGRLEQETHFGKDDALINKIVYSYNQLGKQSGYSVYDASGKRISVVPAPTPTPKSPNALRH
jgi:hypothetical protein